MKNFLLLTIFCVAFSFTEVLSNTIYTSPASGTVFCKDVTEWNNVAWTTSIGGGSKDEYIIQPGFTLIVGCATTCSNNYVLLGDVKITIFGKIGFTPANNDLRLGANGEIELALGGQLGFGSGIRYQGYSSTQVSFGVTSYNGPFLAFGPDAMSATQNATTSYLWTGANSTAWNDAGNWLSGTNTFPNSITRNAVIPYTTTSGNFPVISTAVSVHRISIQRLDPDDSNSPAGNLTIASTGSLTVDDSLKNQGTITVQSGGSLVQTVNSATCLCTNRRFVIERNLGSVSPWYMGSPMRDLGVSGYTIYPAVDNGKQFNPNGVCDPVAVGTTTAYIAELREGATAIDDCSHSLWHTKSSGIFTPGRGYAVYSNPSTTMTFQGQNINNGAVSYGPLGYSNKPDVTLPIPYAPSKTTRGWHMISNPYPSPIELTSAQRLAMGFESQVQIWNSATGSWQAINPLATVTLAVGQGFQIRVAGGVGNSATFAVDNSFRRTTTGVAFYKNDDILQDKYLNVTLNSGAKSNTAMVYFQDGATNGFDAAFDASRLFGLPSEPVLYTVEQSGENLSYNALPLLSAQANQTVPLGFFDATVGNKSLTFEGVGTLGANVMLEDLKLGTINSVDDNFVYNFTSQANDSRNRFLLHFNSSTVSSVTDVKANKVVLFPNPANSTARVMLQADHGFSGIVVSDMNGKVVLSETILAQETEKLINLTDLANGVYFVNLTGNTTSKLKLMKQ